MNEEVQIVDVEPLMVLGMRKKGRYEEIPKMIGKMCEFAVEKKVDLKGAPVFVCHEITADEAKKANEEGNADVEVAFPVSKKTRASKDIKCYELPGGRMAKILHKGPYQECGSAYEKLFSWIKENGKEIAGPTREVYLNDPNTVAKEEILTEIYAPIN